jgi:hypothetical protein
VVAAARRHLRHGVGRLHAQGMGRAAGAYTRSLFSST